MRLFIVNSVVQFKTEYLKSTKTIVIGPWNHGSDKTICIFINHWFNQTNKSKKHFNQIKDITIEMINI